MNFKILHQKAMNCAANYFTAESDLIEILQQVESCRGYREVKCKSLYAYARKLGLSEHVALTMITIARKSRAFPALLEKLRAREITLSNARAITSILTTENQTKWLAAASVMTKHALMREIVKTHPKEAVTERVEPVADGILKLTLGISDEMYEELKRAQEILSSQEKRPVSLAETIQKATRGFLKKEDPIEKAKRSRASTKVISPYKREIPAVLRHQINLRDQNRCTHTANGERCPERKWLDIHHVQPFAEGGLTTLENLTTLCRGHHQLTHSSRDELLREDFDLSPKEIDWYSEVAGW